MNAGKNIVITGISSELGAHLARRLAEDPAVNVIGTMRRLRLKTDIYPSNVQIIDGCDLTNTESCEKLFGVVEVSFNTSFGFIHSVGDFWNHVKFEEYGPEQAHRLFDSHVQTLYNCLTGILPLMKLRNGGSCIAFSCNSVRYNYPWMAAFTASKSAVDSLVRSLANEYAGEGIRLNSLALASLKTEKVMQSKPHGDFKHFVERDDLIPIIEFLLSDKSRLVNGNSINIFEHSPTFYHTGYFERVGK